MPTTLHRFPFRAMGSPCEIKLYAEDPAEAAATAASAIAEIERIEAKYSRYRASSLLARINASAGNPEGIALDDETASLLDYAETGFQQSDGLFDITSGVLREVWNFRSGSVPKPADVARVLPRVGWRKVRWERPRLVMPAGMELDFGGYGKEYAADRVAMLCRGRGVSGGLVDLGGDVSVIGPHPSGAGWVVGVREPLSGNEAVASLEVSCGGVATSGDYQRFIEVGGRRYAHILNPRTGWPVAGLTSVTVVASHCLIAGTASTIAMLKGRDGPGWLDALGAPNLRIHANGEISGTLQPPEAGKEAGGVYDGNGVASKGV